MVFSFASILILIVVVCALIAIPAIVIALAMSVKRKPGRNVVNTDAAPCPSCDQLVTLAASHCEKCGHEFKAS